MLSPKSGQQHRGLRGLYAITPDCADDAALFAQVSAVLAGGCRLLQYRDKLSSDRVRLQRAQYLRTLCQTSGALLIINDELELAQAVDADGVHLGLDDGDLSAARSQLGPDKIIGASCYADPQRAVIAAEAGADYIAFGAVFPSPTKPHAARAALSVFAHTARPQGLPACAIGGITVGNAAQVIAAGADMVAVITDLFDAPDPAARAAQFQALFTA